MRPDQCYGHKESIPAPLRFALVPVEPTREMEDEAVYAAVNLAKGRPWFPFAWEAALRESSGNDLLQRIARARDNLQSVRNCRGSETCDVMDAVNALTEVLNELGGEQ